MNKSRLEFLRLGFGLCLLLHLFGVDSWVYGKVAFMEIWPIYPEDYSYNGFYGGRSGFNVAISYFGYQVFCGIRAVLALAFTFDLFASHENRKRIN